MHSDTEILQSFQAAGNLNSYVTAAQHTALLHLHTGQHRDIYISLILVCVKQIQYVPEVTVRLCVTLQIPQT